MKVYESPCGCVIVTGVTLGYSDYEIKVDKSYRGDTQYFSRACKVAAALGNSAYRFREDQWSLDICIANLVTHLDSMKDERKKAYEGIQ